MGKSKRAKTPVVCGCFWGCSWRAADSAPVKSGTFRGFGGGSQNGLVISARTLRPWVPQTVSHGVPKNPRLRGCLGVGVASKNPKVMKTGSFGHVWRNSKRAEISVVLGLLVFTLRGFGGGQVVSNESGLAKLPRALRPWVPQPWVANQKARPKHPVSKRLAPLKEPQKGPKTPA